MQRFIMMAIMLLLPLFPIWSIYQLFALPAQDPAHSDFWALIFMAIVNFFLGISFVWVSIRNLYLNKNMLFAFLGLYGISSTVISMIVAFAMFYRDYGLIDGDTMVQRPQDFLYFSIATWTTLGYGDIRPTVASRPFAATEAIFGYIYMSLYAAFIFQVLSFTAGAEVAKR